MTALDRCVWGGDRNKTWLDWGVGWLVDETDWGIVFGIVPYRYYRGSSFTGGGGGGGGGGLLC